jgi:hypothetical protein
MSRHALLSLSAVALSLLSTPALAQSRLPAFDLERLQFEPGALGSLVVGTGRTLDQGVFRGSVQLQYAQQPLSFAERWDPQTTQSLVEGRFTTHVTAAYGVLSWLQVDAQVPFILIQTGKSTFEALPPAKRGLGTPWLGVRAGVLSVKNGAPLNLAVAVSGALPVGSAEALARDDFAVYPRLQAGLQADWFQVGLEAGPFLRSEQDITPYSNRPKDVIGNELRLGGTVTSLGGKKTRGEVSLLLGIPLSGGRLNTEVLLAIRRHVTPWLDLYVLGGPGLGVALDTPAFRVFAGASFSNALID